MLTAVTIAVATVVTVNSGHYNGGLSCNC